MTQAEVCATHARQTKSQTRLLENVAVVVAGNRIVPDQLQVRGGTWRMALAHDAALHSTWDNARRPRLRCESFHIRVVDSYAMGKHRPRFQYAVRAKYSIVDIF